MSLAALLTYCKERGISGSYGGRHEERGYRARIMIDGWRYSALGVTKEESLDLLAASVLDQLMDPMPMPGCVEHTEWIERRRACR